MSAEDTVGTPVTGDNDETYVPPAGYTYNDPVWDDPNWLERLFGGTGTTNDKLLAMLGFGLASLIESRNRQPDPIKTPEYVPAPVYDRALTAPMRDVNSLGSKLFFNPNPFQLDPVEAAKKYGPSPEEIQSAADIYRTGLASLQVPDDAPIFNASNTRGKRYVANATAPVKLMDVLNRTPIVPPESNYDPGGPITTMPIPDDVAGPAVMVDDGNGGMTDWRNNPTGSPVTAPSVLEQSNAFAPTTTSAYTPNVGTSWSELLAPFNGARWDGSGGEDTSVPNWALWNAVSQYKALQEPPPELWTANRERKIQREKDRAAKIGRPYEGNWETKGATWTPPQAELDRQRAVLESWASNPGNQYYDPTSEFFNQQLYDQNWGPNSQPTRPSSVPFLPPDAPPPMPYASGGPVRGPGTGTSDSIPALINGRQPARLSNGEFVLPARFVSALGGGSNNVGTARIQNMVDRAMNRFRRA